MYYNIRMDKDFLIDTTKQIYRVTLLFPKKEPLRYNTRETANNVFNNYILKRKLFEEGKQKERYQKVLFEVQKDLDVLFGQLEVAKYQNWVSHFEILELQEKYQKIDLEIKKEIKELVFEKNNVKKEEKPEKIDPRKEKILETLKSKEKAQVRDIVEVLPKVSKRTIRRDFNDLMEKGIIRRIGTGNETFYSLNS